MQAFFSFLIVPAVIAAIFMGGQWWSGRSLPRPSALDVPAMTQLPPNVRELLAQIRETPGEPLRLSALMPAEVADRISPPPPPPDRRPASERFRLASVLLASGTTPSAVIDGQVIEEGGRIGEYRLARVAADHVWLAGPQGRERVDLDVPPALVAAAMPRSMARVAPAGGTPALPPAPDAATLERQYRRLLENLVH